MEQTHWRVYVPQMGAWLNIRKFKAPTVIPIPELERAVIAAAVEWQDAMLNKWRTVPQETALLDAVDALLKARASG